MSLVLLLILTLSLGAYSASAAHTIDQNYTEQVLYDDAGRHGARGRRGSTTRARTSTSLRRSRQHYVDGVDRGDSLPLVPGDAADRSERRRPVSSSRSSAWTTRRIGWWRKDFADKPLGALMNALGAGDAATLVSRSFLDNYQLKIGDSYTLSIDGKPVDFYVAEVVDYFPTLYPEKGDFWVANLDYVYDQIGMQPYRVWLKLDPNKKSADVVDEIRANQIRVVSIKDSRVAVNAGRTDPQRTGLFGALTVGFASPRC